MTESKIELWKRKIANSKRKQMMKTFEALKAPQRPRKIITKEDFDNELASVFAKQIADEIDSEILSVITKSSGD